MVRAKVLSLTATDDGECFEKERILTMLVYRDPECTEPADDKEEGTTGIQELIHAATYYLKITGLDGQ